MWRKLRTEFPSLSWDDRIDQEEDTLAISACIAELDSFFSLHRTRCDAYLAACQEQGVKADRAAFSMVQLLDNGVMQMRDELQALRDEVSASGVLSTPQRLKWQRLFRAAVQARVSMQRELAWTSTAYYHSVISNSFEPQRYGDFGAYYNYDRNYGYFRGTLAANLAEALGVSPQEQGILLSSSGMAGFTLIENYLTSEVLGPGACIYYPRPLYGETDAVGFRNPKLFSIVRDDYHNAQVIADRIRELGADVAVIEGMQNYLGNRIIDVRELIANLERSPAAKPVHLIVDETLLTGAYPLRELRSSPMVRVFTYLSGTKYLQWGLDSQLMGAVVVPKELEPQLQRVNDYLGLSLTEVSALSYPQFPREVFHWRMKRLTRNSIALCALLKERCAASGGVDVFHPLLDAAEHRERLAFCGSLLTVRAATTKGLLGDGNFVRFHKAIRRVVDRCRDLQIPIAYTEGFGFSTPRIYVGWCKNFPPYLRVSAGDQSLAETAMLADALYEALSGSA